MSAVLNFRLSDGWTKAIEFSAFDARSLEAGALHAVRRWRVDCAGLPGYFETLNDLAAHGRYVEAETAEAKRVAKLREWRDRGHSEDSCERLWKNFVWGRESWLHTRRNDASRFFVPDRLEIHQASTAIRDHWLSPCNDLYSPLLGTVDGVIRRRRRGDPVVSWAEVWHGALQMRRHDESLGALAKFASGNVRRDTPSLRIVPSGPEPETMP